MSDKSKRDEVKPREPKPAADPSPYDKVVGDVDEAQKLQEGKEFVLKAIYREPGKGKRYGFVKAGA